MEWILANWELVLAAVGGLFYVAEKIVKENKNTAWNDILVDGIKWLAKRGPKKQLMVLLALPLFSCTATAPPHLQEECADSYLVQNYDYYQSGSLVIQLSNISAIRNNVYTKEQAMAVFEEIEALLKTEGVSYARLAMFVLAKIDWVHEHAGVELFILADFLVDMKANTAVIHPCDAEIMLKDVAKLKLYTGMI